MIANFAVVHRWSRRGMAEGVQSTLSVRREVHLTSRHLFRGPVMAVSAPTRASGLGDNRRGHFA